MRFRASVEEKKQPRRLRIVIVAPRIEHLIGGQEVQAQLLLHLWSHDPALEVSYLATNLQLADWLERVPYLRTIVRFPLYLTELLAGLPESDVVHIFSASFSSFLISTVPAYCVSRIFRKKTIINYRSGLADRHMRTSRIACIILRHADRVLVPSPYLIEVFREFHIAACAIPNVVDLSVFSYRPRISLRPLLLCSRNLETHYGVDTVLRAFAEIKKSFSDARLWILGEGSQETAIRRLIANLNLEGVEMPGQVPRECISRFYNQADILINASRVDNMPVSILEAFASGLPVVSSNAGGIPYVVRHEQTGLLCDPEDWKQLAANVIRLLQHPELTQRLTENAYRQSFSYHWDGIRQEWLRVYRGLDPRS